MRIVHLPFYDDNPYQQLLIDAQRDLGHEVFEGGGGGNFLGIALREWRADVLHFHWLHPYLLRPTTFASIARASRFLAEVAILKARGTKIAWTIHNLVNHDHLHPQLERRFSTAFAKLAEACFVHSHAAATAAAARFSIPPAKLHVIPHGNYIDAYPNDVPRDQARANLSLPADATVFLFLGRIEPYKGVNHLVDAFLGLPGDPHLVIAGKVADSEQLPAFQSRTAQSSRIHFFPQRIPDTDLQNFFNAADHVVFPFEKILTSGSLVLAMSFAKAVVAPRLPSLEEILPPAGVTWFDPGCSGSLAQALREAATNTPGIAGEANFQRANQWPWSAVAATITDTISAA